MAKSIRSKRKRKIRNLKRERNAPRELKKLKQVVTNLKESILSQETCTVTKPEDLKKKVENENGETMDTSVKRNKKTMKDENGHYPVWLSGRKTKQLKANTKGKKIGKKKKIAW